MLPHIPSRRNPASVPTRVRSSGLTRLSVMWPGVAIVEGELAIDEQRPCWFVGAAFGGVRDQTDRFLGGGIWVNGYADRYLDLVKSIRLGDRIAIKSTYTKKRELPFDNRGLPVAVMAIKAIGEVTENIGDGRRLRVSWRRVAPPKEWYFYTHQRAVWKVEHGQGAQPDAARALIRRTPIVIIHVGQFDSVIE